MQTMKGKRALITGGSAGLGAAIAHKLASLGVICAVNYANNTTRAEELLASLPGKDHVLVQGSPFTRDGAHQIVKTAIEKLGTLDYIASNAGWTKFADFNDISELIKLRKVSGCAHTALLFSGCYAANVKSHLWVMQAAQDVLTQNKGARASTYRWQYDVQNIAIRIIRDNCISGGYQTLRKQHGVLCGSTVLYDGDSDTNAYLLTDIAVSKSATIHLSKCLAKSCAPNVTVNCVSPGLMKTDWAQGFSAEQYAKVEASSILGRIAEVDEVADVAISLLTNRGMTGQNIEISAGFAM